MVIRLTQGTALQNRLLGVSHSGSYMVVEADKSDSAVLYAVQPDSSITCVICMYGPSSGQPVCAGFNADDTTIGIANGDCTVTISATGTDDKLGSFAIDEISKPACIAVNADTSLVAVTDCEGTVVVTTVDGYELKRFTRICPSPLAAWFAGSSLIVASHDQMKQIRIS